MSEFLQNPDAGAAPHASSSVTGIRQARLNKGLSLETLASVLKVTPAKLDALESGRYEELPDLAFARALAKTVCRYLGLDPATVLSSFPSIQPVDLSSSDHKGVPFKASKARLNLDMASSMPFKLELKAQWLVPLGILLAALAVYFMPAQNGLLQGLSEHVASWATPASAAASSASPDGAVSGAASAPALPAELVQQNASAAEVVSSESQEPVLASAPMASAVDALPVGQPASVAASGTASGLAAANSAMASAPVAVPPFASVDSGPVALLASEPAWVEIKDATGTKVLSRHMLAGESASVGGQAPFNVKIGNAAAVKLSYRGQPVELAAFSRSNVARLDLK
jgi:cytoskeleton protein RodZ